MRNIINHGRTQHRATKCTVNHRIPSRWCGICRDWFWPDKEWQSMPELRETPVKFLSPDQCGKLLVHNHGGGLTEDRRKAYLLKRSGNAWSAYFPDATEASRIQSLIEQGI